MHHREVAAEPEQLRQERAQHGRVVAPLGDVPVPERERHRFGLLGVVTERHQRGIETPAAAPDHHVDGDPLALEHLPEAERRGALHASGADDERDALARRGAHAG